MWYLAKIYTSNPNNLSRTRSKFIIWKAWITCTDVVWIVFTRWSTWLTLFFTRMVWYSQSIMIYVLMLYNNTPNIILTLKKRNPWSSILHQFLFHVTCATVAKFEMKSYVYTYEGILMNKSAIKGIGVWWYLSLQKESNLYICLKDWNFSCYKTYCFKPILC